MDPVSAIGLALSTAKAVKYFIKLLQDISSTPQRLDQEFEWLHGLGRILQRIKELDDDLEDPQLYSDIEIIMTHLQPCLKSVSDLTGQIESQLQKLECQGLKRQVAKVQYHYQPDRAYIESKENIEAHMRQLNNCLQAMSM